MNRDDAALEQQVDHDAGPAVLNIGVLGGPRWITCSVCGLVEADDDDQATCRHGNG